MNSPRASEEIVSMKDSIAVPANTKERQKIFMEIFDSMTLEQRREVLRYIMHLRRNRNNQNQ